MDTTVMLGHGSGGTMMKRIIDEVFFAAYAGEELLRGDDAAVLPAPAQGERLAFSTDSFVVTPHFFPGGDIGRLAVCGTVNDVATSGATPRYLSCGFVLEEGFPIEDLKRICASMAEVAQGGRRAPGHGRYQGGEPRPRRRRVHQHRGHRHAARGREPGRRAVQARR